jgi:hypothetical protein
VTIRFPTDRRVDGAWIQPRGLRRTLVEGGRRRGRKRQTLSGGGRPCFSPRSLHITNIVTATLERSPAFKRAALRSSGAELYSASASVAARSALTTFTCSEHR